MADAGMDREIAILVVNACYRACRELGEMALMIGELAPDDDGRNIKMQSGSAIGEIGKITEAIFRIHPDLEAYVESRIDKFGRVS